LKGRVGGDGEVGCGKGGDASSRSGEKQVASASRLRTREVRRWSTGERRPVGDDSVKPKRADTGR
jgi:hypothetical protein